MIKILAPFLAFALLVGCAGGKPATLGEHGSPETPGVISFRGGGSAEPWYEKPVRMTDGNYRPPAANEEAQRRGIAAAQAEERKPKFTGRVMCPPVQAGGAPHNVPTSNLVRRAQ